MWLWLLEQYFGQSILQSSSSVLSIRKEVSFSEKKKKFLFGPKKKKKKEKKRDISFIDEIHEEEYIMIQPKCFCNNKCSRKIS